MEQEKFTIMKRLKSFVYAFNGLKILIKEEHNARIHLLAVLCVLIVSIVFKISVLEWIAITLAMGFVIAMEIVNSAIENISDFISPDKHEKIQKIKDLSAAAVLVSAITALIVGILVFLPKIIKLC